VPAARDPRISHKGPGYSVSGGNLRLAVTREAPFTCANPYGDTTARYLGGGISTFGRFSQAYGRFEVRMKFPKYDGPGLHGGFWMNPQNRDYGIWPGSGEIDVAEWYSNTADHAAGGGLNNSPTPNTPFPATTVIDYAKAWR